MRKNFVGFFVLIEKKHLIKHWRSTFFDRSIFFVLTCQLVESIVYSLDDQSGLRNPEIQMKYLHWKSFLVRFFSQENSQREEINFHCEKFFFESPPIISSHSTEWRLIIHFVKNSIHPTCLFSRYCFISIMQIFVKVDWIFHHKNAWFSSCFRPWRVKQ